MRFVRPVLLPACLFSTLLLTGCALHSTAPSSASTAGAAIQGTVHGGQQPINLAHVYLMQAGTTGYGQPSLSLLNAASTGNSDSVGAYVTTNVRGFFTITGDYSCTPGTQVYLLVLQGDAGGGNNTAAGEVGVFGQCPSSGSFLASLPRVQINEVTTVAASYALAGFATDILHVSSPSTPAALTGLANAFLNSGNIANIVTAPNSGSLVYTPAGNGLVPYQLVNTMASIIASCVNSTGPASGACQTLFSNALSNGSTGTQATDTASALINIAHNPTANVGNLYNLSPATPAFSPTLAAQPSDFTLALTFTGARLSNFPYGFPNSIATDSNGNMYSADPTLGAQGINKFSPQGADLSSSSTFNGNSTDMPYVVKVDAQNNVWVLNGANNHSNLAKFSIDGTLLSGAGYTGGSYTANSGFQNASFDFDPGGNVAVNFNLFNASGSLISPQPAYPANSGPGVVLHFDPADDLWYSPAAGQLAKLLPSGVAAAGSPYSGGGLSTAAGIPDFAFDRASNIWALSNTGLSVFTSDGQPVFPNGIQDPSGSQPETLAFDGDGSLFYANNLGNSVQKVVVSGSTLQSITSVGKGLLNTVITNLIVEGSGDVWVADFKEGSNSSGPAFSNARMVEFIGLSAPVVTPVATGLKNGTLATRP